MIIYIYIYIYIYKHKHNASMQRLHMFHPQWLLYVVYITTYTMNQYQDCGPSYMYIHLNDEDHIIHVQVGIAHLKVGTLLGTTNERILIIYFLLLNDVSATIHEIVHEHH